MAEEQQQTDATAIEQKDIMHKLANDIFIPHLQQALVEAQKTGSTNIQIIGAISNAFSFMLEDVIGPQATADLLKSMGEKIQSDVEKYS